MKSITFVSYMTVEPNQEEINNYITYCIKKYLLKIHELWLIR